MNAEKRFGAPPVIIGGCGGSGTRVVAEVLIRCGYYLGADRNLANDNSWFTLLFVHPRWFGAAHETGGEPIRRAIRLFDTAMAGRVRPGAADIAKLLRTTARIALFGHTYKHNNRGSWAIRKLTRLLLAPAVDPARFVGWGWKEPNTHIYLEYLNQLYPGLKYIHVIRHGLDMAYSHNQAQMYNWGPYLGIDSPDASRPLPKASLQYWIRANQRAVSLGRTLLGDRFCAINFDQLCADPTEQIDRLLAFVGCHPVPAVLEGVRQLPRSPQTTGRHLRQDLTIFSREEMDAVARFGFTVPSADPDRH